MYSQFMMHGQKNINLFLDHDEEDEEEEEDEQGV